MTTQTEQKTRRPLLRTVTGIAAAAACIGITGALGLALFHMSRDGGELNAASQEGTEQVLSDTEQNPADAVPTVPFEDYAAAYYEKLAGHPVSFDWSTLWGTNLNETWELPENTVTLNAALTDGEILQFYYTVKPKWNWSNNPEYNAKLPVLSILPSPLSSTLVTDNSRSAGFNPEAVIDDTLREDGTIRVCCCQMGIPLNMGGEFRVTFGDNGNASYSESNAHVITLNLPDKDELPQERILSIPLHTEIRQDGSEFQADFTRAIATPLGVSLTDRVSSVIIDGDVLLSEEPEQKLFWVQTVYAAKVSQGIAEDIPVSDLGSQHEAFGMQAFMTSTYLGSETVMHDCFLPFSEPQDLSQAEAIRFTSNTQEEPAELLLSDESLAGPDVADGMYVLCDRMTDEQMETAMAQLSLYSDTMEKAEAAIRNGDWSELESDFLVMLGNLIYEPGECTAEPEYVWKAYEGMTYRFSFTERRVWKGSGDAQQGTTMPRELSEMIQTYADKVGIVRADTPDGAAAQNPDAVTGAAEPQSLLNEIGLQLNALTWSPETCDGIPEYTWSGTDGTAYYLNLSGGWVWRGNGAAQKEAKLTDSLKQLLKQYQEQFGLEEWER